MGTCNGKSTNVDMDHYKSLLCSEKFQQIPIVSLEQAVEPLISILPTIKTYVHMVKQKCLNPADGLTSDESAAIMLNSVTWQPLNECFYTILNCYFTNIGRK